MTNEQHNVALVREWALQKAMQYHEGKKSSLEEIILDAKKISQWYENKSSAELKRIK